MMSSTEKNDRTLLNSALENAREKFGCRSNSSVRNQSLKNIRPTCEFEGCKKSFSQPNHLKAHQRIHTGERPFVCSYCQRTFIANFSLKMHLRTHTDERPYECTENLCKKRFKSAGDLQKHGRIHTGERPFHCDVCGKSFSTNSIKKVHMRVHTGEKPFICDKGCDKTFASFTNYQNHVRIHTGEKPFVCQEKNCNKRFTERSSLYKHTFAHQHTKRHNCYLCGRTYKQLSSLAFHRRTVHNIIEGCGAGKIFFLKFGVSDEESDPNVDGDAGDVVEDPFKSDLLPMTSIVSSQDAGNASQRMYSDARPFPCILCLQSFATKYTLETHLRTHTGERPYECSENKCQKSFKTPGDLVKHMRIHTGERPFNCEVCHKLFTTISNRNVHMRTHTGEKRYSCDKGCSKSFSSFTNFNNHLQIHNGDKLISTQGPDDTTYSLIDNCADGEIVYLQFDVADEEADSNVEVHTPADAVHPPKNRPVKEDMIVDDTVMNVISSSILHDEEPSLIYSHDSLVAADEGTIIVWAPDTQEFIALQHEYQTEESGSIALTDCVDMDVSHAADGFTWDQCIVMEHS